MTHLVDDGPGVFLGDGSWEALEDLVQCETLCVPVQLTSSPGGRGRGRGRAWVSLHSAHDDSLPRHYSGLMSVKLSQHKSIHSFVIVVSGIPDQQLSLIVLTTPKYFFVHFELVLLLLCLLRITTDLILRHQKRHSVRDTSMEVDVLISTTIEEQKLK